MTIYPAYLDKKKTTGQGRRVPLQIAVETPLATEINDVLSATGFNPILEKNKMYPRDQDRDLPQGRVKVQLKNDDGTPKFPNHPNKQSVYKLLCEMIPQLKMRQPGFAAATSSAQPAAAGGNKKNKKKK
ncbi:hypothetical protein WR25_15275 [Diploscapter pachys]|uniref:SRP19 protein n=1 Tax=Diploscapter pachys TaxID=2018661 RepID=A0A2A2KFW9_9BILA|nr:hypothetical protein WR25_15275 [Diploscapter pachys]